MKSGACRRGGRLNCQGRGVDYMSESLSLCVLAKLVHMVKVPMLQSFKCIRVVYFFSENWHSFSSVLTSG